MEYADFNDTSSSIYTEVKFPRSFNRGFGEVNNTTRHYKSISNVLTQRDSRLTNKSSTAKSEIKYLDLVESMYSGVCEVPLCEVPLCEAPLCEVPLCEVPLCEVPSCEVPLCEVPSSEVPLCEVQSWFGEWQAPNQVEEQVCQNSEHATNPAEICEIENRSEKWNDIIKHENEIEWAFPRLRILCICI